MAATCVQPHRRVVPARARRITIDGERHSVVLCDKHHRDLLRSLQQVLKPYLIAGRTGAISGRAGLDGLRPAASGAARKTPTTASTASRYSITKNADPQTAAYNATVRAWAADYGIAVNARGPLPAQVREAYESSTTTNARPRRVTGPTATTAKVRRRG